jgi:hypothetical protein
MNPYNSLKYHLKKNDVLYFLHIPKTAGTIFLLENYFNLDVILSAQSWHLLSKTFPQDFSKFRLVKGHFANTIHQIIPKNLVYITMLRNPSDVIISYLRMQKRQPDTAKKWNISGHDSISELILRQDIPGVENPLCHWLNFNGDIASLTKGFDKKLLSDFLLPAQPDFLQSDLSAEEILENAKQQLLKCTFFGLTERFEDSLILLHYTFSWKPYNSMIKLNIAPDSLEELSSEAKKELEQKTKLDIELYKFAQSIFDTRFDQMVKHLREKYNEPYFNTMNTTNVIYEILEKDYEDHFLDSHVPSSSIMYTFDQKIDGSGWHQREISPTKIFRWTGPETISTIDFALIDHKDLKIQFHVIDTMAPDILNSIQLKVNEISCILNFSKDAFHEKGGTFETIVSKSMQVNNNNFCRLTFQVNRTISPNSVNPDSTDIRKLGVAMDWIKITN